MSKYLDRIVVSCITVYRNKQHKWIYAKTYIILKDTKIELGLTFHGHYTAYTISDSQSHSFLMFHINNNNNNKTKIFNKFTSISN